MKGGCGCDKTTSFMKGGSPFFTTSSYHNFDTDNKYHYPLNSYGAGDPSAPNATVSTRILQGGTRRRNKKNRDKKKKMRKSRKNNRRRGGSIFLSSSPIQASSVAQLV